jgi:hypothetical protein
MLVIRRLALGILPWLILLGCAQVLGERTLLITQDELQGKLATIFPLQRKVLEVFGFTVDTPTVTLLPDSRRVATHLDVVIQDRLQGREYRGSLDVSFALRFDPKTQALRLKDVSVDSIRFDGISANAQQALSHLGPMIAHDKLEGQTIYSFKREDLARTDGLGYTVGAIDVTAQGLLIRLIAKP